VAESVPTVAPSKSSRQHRAMEAAARGKSTLGIPRKVGKDFVAADVGRHFKTGGKRK